MSTYQYKARDKSGKMNKGMMVADSQDAVALKLTQMGHIPVDITLAKEMKVSFNLFAHSTKIKFTELNMFTRQLYTLQKAGLPLLSSLNSIKEQATNLRLKDVVGQMAKDIESGLGLSAAMEKHPRIFNRLYTNMIKSGEVSGRLSEILERLATLGEHEEKVRLRIKAASRYPVIVIGALTLGFLILVTFVLPRFVKIYGQFSTELPLPTKILIAVNAAVTQYWWITLLILISAVLLFRMYIKTKNGRFAWDGLKLRIFVFGPLVQKLVMSRFARVTGTLMRSGVPILQILDLVSESANNVVIAKTIQDIKVSVNEGKGMVEPMKDSKMFPPIVTQMVDVGEQTGNLDELLLHVSDYYDSQVDYTISNLVSLIEPILILVLGLGVLMMALGIFLPMWNLMNLFR